MTQTGQHQILPPLANFAVALPVSGNIRKYRSGRLAPKRSVLLRTLQVSKADPMPQAPKDRTTCLSRFPGRIRNGFNGYLPLFIEVMQRYDHRSDQEYCFPSIIYC